MSANPPMLATGEALQRLLDAAEPIRDFETIATLDASGRVLAAAQVSLLDVPSMDNTQMDGYAVRAADCASGAAVLRVAQRLPAGVVGTQLEPGTAARIFTGAMIPPGADAVVMQEDAETDESGDIVRIRRAVTAGRVIPPAGLDL